MPQPKSGRPVIRPSSNARTTSSGSFHAGAPIPSIAALRRSSTHRYQTFPTEPPKTPIDQAHTSGDSSDASLPSSPTSSEHGRDETPLPLRQLLLLAYLSLCEQTALNSISPYLPELVASMPGVPESRTGFYVGILASAFALAQLSTNFMWGYTSDLIGRKPVLLAGTFALMCCFCVFGLCREYWQIVLVHVLMGMLNGNAACVPTVLGEVTDRSNQSKAFAYLPVIYSLGSITGPAVGGLLVREVAGDKYPYLGPNLLSAVMLATGVIVVAIWFEETLQEEELGPGKPAWLVKLSSWVSSLGESTNRRHSWSSRWPHRQQQPLLSDDSASSDDEGEVPINDNGQIKPDTEETADWRDLLNHTTILLLVTYLIFQLSNISFNSLYPIFAASPAPTGRALSPNKIGISLSVSGAATIVFQAFLYTPVHDKIGSMGSYRVALLGIAVSMALMPWVGYKDDKPLFGVGSGKLWLYLELGFVLIVKNVCAVGGLSSVMLLVRSLLARYLAPFDAPKIAKRY